MTEDNNINLGGGETPFDSSGAYMATFVMHLSDLLKAAEENRRLKQQLEAVQNDKAALSETVEKWKNGDEWASRVTYENVVEQIASLEDTSKRDDARRVFEPLLKKSQVTKFRKDIKRRVKELNEESDSYSDKQVAQALEACVGKGLVVDAKWKWAGVYWFLRWTCNYPVDAREFCTKISSLELDIDEDYECSYESIRKLCTLSFMDEDARRMDAVRVSKNDQNMFSQCREIALKLAEELSHT